VNEVRHPIFARFYERLSQWMEREIADRREQLLANLSGRVVEVGAGNGMNFRHYPETVEEVVALEPEAYLRERASEATRQAKAPVTLIEGVADPLPFEDRSFGAAVASLVLCTVPDPAGALAEIRRVLQPEGELRFMEHVRSDGRAKARVQGLLDRSGIWPWFGGGCHCSRDTVAAIEAAGFRIERIERFDLGPSCGPTNPHVIGVARAPAGAP
jgi:ubiquinone/menaquinone biosynthesis C-methylase UbiE